MRVLEILWSRGAADAYTVLDHMPGGRVSLSTVQTTLERLHRKRLVERTKQGRAFRYQASLSQSQLISGLIRDLAQNVAAGDLAPMLSGFLGYVEIEAPEIGSDLKRLLGNPQAEPPGEARSDD